jgi:hypothetical protein
MRLWPLWRSDEAADLVECSTTMHLAQSLSMCEMIAPCSPRAGTLPQGELEAGRRSAEWIAERREIRWHRRLLDLELTQLERDVRAHLKDRKRRHELEEKRPPIILIGPRQTS